MGFAGKLSYRAASRPKAARLKRTIDAAVNEHPRSYSSTTPVPVLSWRIRIGRCMAAESRHPQTLANGASCKREAAGKHPKPLIRDSCGDQLAVGDEHRKLEDCRFCSSSCHTHAASYRRPDFRGPCQRVRLHARRLLQDEPSASPCSNGSSRPSADRPQIKVVPLRGAGTARAQRHHHKCRQLRCAPTPFGASVMTAYSRPGAGNHA